MNLIVFSLNFRLKINLNSCLLILKLCLFRATGSAPKLETLDDLKKHMFTQGGRLKEQDKGKKHWAKWRK